MASENLERLDLLETLKTLVQRVEYYAPQHADICDEAKEAIRQADEAEPECGKTLAIYSGHPVLCARPAGHDGHHTHLWA